MRGGAEQAARLCGAAAAAIERVGSRLTPGGQANYDSATATARAAVGEDAFTEMWTRAACWSLKRRSPKTLFFLNWSASLVRKLAKGLTPREAEVLALLAEGRTDREIGEALFVSRHTARNHVANILAKLGVSSRSAAAAHAVRHGLS